MTKEEKIAELINIRDNYNFTLAPREVFDDAIKALEQEPYFWEKCPYYEPDILFDGKEEYDMGRCIYKPMPCEDAVSRKAVIDVLDKIRAEIAEYKDDKIIHEERNEMIDIVLEIIDKHMRGTENENNNT